MVASSEIAQANIVEVVRIMEVHAAVGEMVLASFDTKLFVKFEGKKCRKIFSSMLHGSQRMSLVILFQDRS